LHGGNDGYEIFIRAVLPIISRLLEDEKTEAIFFFVQPYIILKYLSGSTGILCFFDKHIIAGKN
jgi:hypothetical protein